MKVRYVWIQLFGNIASRGFGFDMEFRFEFDFKSQTLSINRSTFDSQSLFPEKISNVSLIVGENGSGKTTLMRFLTGYLNGNLERSIVVLGNMVYFNSALQNFSLVGNASGNFRAIKQQNGEDFGVGIQFQTLLYGNGFNERSVWEGGYAIDMTLGNQLRQDNAMDDSNLDFLEKHKLAELRRVISFLDHVDSKESQIELPFDPASVNRLRCVFRQPGYQNRENLSRYPKLNAQISNRILPIFLDNQIKRLNHFDARMIGHDAILNYLGALILMNLLGEGAVYHGDPRSLASTQDLRELYLEIFRNLSFPDFEYNKMGMEQFFRMLSDLVDPLYLDFRTSDTLSHINEQTKALNFLLKTSCTLVIGRSGALRFIDLYQAVIVKEPFILFDWGLSSGERAFISMFARFWEKQADIRIGRSILLLIDEGELYFHPEWQRRYLNFLLSNLPQIFHKAPSIQIILTSHSPFVISDLPTPNVIYVRKSHLDFLEVITPGSGQGTFAANIHHLYADSFFLKGALIGEFAKQKVDELIDYLNENNPNPQFKEHFQMILRVIGDPYIKRRLTTMWIDRFNEKPDSSTQ